MSSQIEEIKQKLVNNPQVDVEKDLIGIIEIENDLSDGLSEELQGAKEEAINLLTDIYKEKSDAIAIKNLLQSLNGFFSIIPKAKTGKIVRDTIDKLSKIRSSEDIVVEIAEYFVNWAIGEERTFLRLALQFRLATALYHRGDFQKALKITGPLIHEAKKLDDKNLLVEIHLLESKIYHQIAHLPKAKASLTASRTAAHSVYCAPMIQADLDLQSGILHAETNDFITAYSYFFEAYENFGAITKDKEEVRPLQLASLRYMLLAKIMSQKKEEINSLIKGKLALEFADPALEVMVSIAKAHTESSLNDFKATIDKYRDELEKDALVKRHLHEFYDRLLEKNLLQIIEPFSVVEISHIASLISLDRETIEKKLSQMILDKVLSGILDQANDCLIVYEEEIEDKTYPAVFNIFDDLNEVVDTLYKKASRLH